MNLFYYKLKGIAKRILYAFVLTALDLPCVRSIILSLMATCVSHTGMFWYNAPFFATRCSPLVCINQWEALCVL